MPLYRTKKIITKHDIRPSLIAEMKEKEDSFSLQADAKDEIIKYFFYKATEHRPLSLTPAGMQAPACVFESPFRASTPGKTKEELAVETHENINYANACALSLIQKGFMPYGSHIKYTGPLKDADAHERTVGIVYGKLEEVNIPKVVTFYDRGISFGMLKGLELHLYLRKSIQLTGLQTWKGEKTYSLEQANNYIDENLVTPQEKIIAQIDDIIGVNTI